MIARRRGEAKRAAQERRRSGCQASGRARTAAASAWRTERSG
ncbi:MAG: hypothetical protein ACK52I_19010 [Pseudomonadota bacterium]